MLIVPPPELFHYTDAVGLLQIVEERTIAAPDVRFLGADPDQPATRRALGAELRALASSDLRGLPSGDLIPEGLQLLEHGLGAYRSYAVSLAEDGDLVSEWWRFGRGQAFAVAFDGHDLEQRCHEDVGGVTPRLGAMLHVLEDVAAALEEGMQPLLRPDAPTDHEARRDVWAQVLSSLLARFDRGGARSQHLWRWCCTGVPAGAAPVEFRATTAGLAPVVRLPLRAVRVLRVVVGPSPHAERQAAAVRDLLQHRGLGDVAVLVSHHAPVAEGAP